MLAWWSASLNVPVSAVARLHSDADDPHRVAVHHDDLRVGVLREQGVERDRVLRRLQRPAPGGARLQQLQHEMVVLVRRGLVTVDEPLVVGRHVRHDRELQALEVLGEQGDALGGFVRRLVVDRLHARIERVQHLGAGARLLDARIGRERRGLGGRHAVPRLPAHERAPVRVTAEQARHQRRTGAGQSEDDEGRDDLLVAHLGMLRHPVDHAEAIDEVARHLGLHREGARPR